MQMEEHDLDSAVPNGEYGAWKTIHQEKPMLYELYYIVFAALLKT